MFFPPTPKKSCFALQIELRIELEVKAKVIAYDWGAEFVELLAALAVLPWSTYLEKESSHYRFKNVKNIKCFGSLTLYKQILHLQYAVYSMLIETTI